MAGFYGQFLDTVGMEYESTSMTREYAAEHLMRAWINAIGPTAKQINVTRDASIEFIASRIGLGGSVLSVSQHTKAAKFLSGESMNSQVYGFEVFTSPMELPAFEKLLYPMMFTLEKFGDFTSNRASIHLHFGFVNNLRLLKNLLRLCLMLDPVLYRLGGMGRTFRGSSNLAAYCRPLLNPIAVPISTSIQSIAGMLSPSELQELKNTPIPEFGFKWAKIINPLAALEAETMEDFWASFGINYPGGGSYKYHPSRYHGCNFFAVPAHGTMEFRHFNQSLSPTLIMAIAKFLRGSLEMVTLLNKHETQVFDVIDPGEEIPVSDATEVIHRVLALCREKEVENLPSDGEIDLLVTTIEASHFEPLPPTPVLTHIREADFRLPVTVAVRGKLEGVHKTLPPQQVDIHNIGEKIISIFD